MPVDFEELELPFDGDGPPTCAVRRGDPPRNPLGTFVCCPHCGGEMRPEHAHFRCAGCGWRDSCCD